MTDKAYTTVDLVIFGVHPCFLRFFYDLPRIFNTCITYFHSQIIDEQARETVEPAGSEGAELADDSRPGDRSRPANPPDR
ncbi:hypothetical protein ACWFRF_28835 [Nocardia sp. NPDC055165]